jgi:hypothetical protein
VKSELVDFLNVFFPRDFLRSVIFYIL